MQIAWTQLVLPVEDHSHHRLVQQSLHLPVHRSPLSTLYPNPALSSPSLPNQLLRLVVRPELSSVAYCPKPRFHRHPRLPSRARRDYPIGLMRLLSGTSFLPPWFPLQTGFLSCQDLSFVFCRIVNLSLETLVPRRRGMEVHGFFPLSHLLRAALRLESSNLHPRGPNSRYLVLCI